MAIFIIAYRSMLIRDLRIGTKLCDRVLHMQAPKRSWNSQLEVRRSSSRGDNFSLPPSASSSLALGPIEVIPPVSGSELLGCVFGDIQIVLSIVGGNVLLSSTVNWSRTRIMLNTIPVSH